MSSSHLRTTFDRILCIVLERTIRKNKKKQEKEEDLKMKAKKKSENRKREEDNAANSRCPFIPSLLSFPPSSSSHPLSSSLFPSSCRDLIQGDHPATHPAVPFVLSHSPRSGKHGLPYSGYTRINLNKWRRSSRARRQSDCGCLVKILASRSSLLITIGSRWDEPGRRRDTRSCRSWLSHVLVSPPSVMQFSFSRGGTTLSADEKDVGDDIEGETSGLQLE